LTTEGLNPSAIAWHIEAPMLNFSGAMALVRRAATNV